MPWKSHQPKHVYRQPRLWLTEFESMGRACKQMDALAAMLHASTWNGKGVALTELAQAYEAIAAIYNRVEAVAFDKTRGYKAAKPQDASGEGGTGESSGRSRSAAPAAPEA